MRIHTDADSYDVRQIDTYIPGVRADVTEHGSRTHRHAFEVQLTGTGYARNSGTYGASNETGATWDEWGIWLNLLFDLDPGARVGGTVKRPIYAGRADFHQRTDERYKTLKVEDQHRRHRWSYDNDIDGPRRVCKCGAKLYPPNAVNPHASLAH